MVLGTITLICSIVACTYAAICLFIVRLGERSYFNNSDSKITFNKKSDGYDIDKESKTTISNRNLYYEKNRLFTNGNLKHFAEWYVLRSSISKKNIDNNFIHVITHHRQINFLISKIAPNPSSIDNNLDQNCYSIDIEYNKYNNNLFETDILMFYDGYKIHKDITKKKR